jgi:glycosyltransferase involved in cell wall biosynthesis
LFTSHFAYGPVAKPEAYRRREFFYRAAFGRPAGRVRMASKLVQHVPDMLRYRRAARAADVVHFQWLAVQHLDGPLLPPRRTKDGRRRPLVLTAHDVLPREPRPGQLAAQRRLYDRFDAIVVHSENGRTRLVEELGADPDRVHVIAHGVFTHLAARPEEGDLRAPVRARRAPTLESNNPVVLMFGLMRPYKGIDVLLDAWRGTDGQAPIADAELWIAGMPKMDLTALDAAHGGVLGLSSAEHGSVLGLSSAEHSTRPGALPCSVQDRQGAHGRIRVFPWFIGDDELPAYFERADLVVLPYLQADQSGVLFTALAFGKPLLLSDVGGFPELASTGAARIAPAGDARALGAALRELLADRAALTEMCVKARAAATGRYSWRAIAAAHIELYRSL